jgi:hypothetical protein
MMQRKEALLDIYRCLPPFPNALTFRRLVTVARQLVEYSRPPYFATWLAQANGQVQYTGEDLPRWQGGDPQAQLMHHSSIDVVFF